MSSLELATKMAQEAGFDIAVFEKEWNGYEVFYGDIILEEGQIAPCLGLPYYMLVKDGKIRLTTGKEKYAICGISVLPPGTIQNFDEIMAELEKEEE